MNDLLSKYPELAGTSPEEKLAMIDELWEMVRRSEEISVPESHREELDRRVSEVLADPAKALSPEVARAQFRK